ncbi:hypothetical protein Pfo_010883 [Paulownia fortunei]|nr:hypothetical protein Pfo_010883 [Paulownia fortunei]
MAGNDWINSYLEAILDVDTGINDHKSSLLLRERGRFSPAQYFVEEVITGFNETDLHRSWVRASAIRNSEERNTRLENMCWRIWTLARKKKQIEGEEAQRRTKRHLEREKARREATADMSEDLSEGEKGDTVGDISAHGDSVRGRMPRVSSVDMMANLASQHTDRKLYLVLISLHGLIRGENMELGRDSDTGGQVKYVVELARALGSMPGVFRVDLLTRQVLAPDVDWTYGEPTEMLNPLNSENHMNEIGESGGAYIIRIPFGPKDKYLSKEVLWPHIPEFVDGALGHILQMSKVLGKQIGSDQPLWPIAIHGHYADAGNSAALLSGVLNVPMVFTGHSLGRDKLEQLLKQGRQSREEINSTYKIMRRIEAEEMTLDVSEVIITSTRQEIEEQWRLYDGFDPVLESKLRARIKRNVSCYGRFMPRMVVVPPGMEFRNVVPQDGDMDGEVEGNEDSSGTPDPPIWSEIMRFFTNPHKPIILALARPDPKKNLITLVKAFGECRQLRELANLTLIMGNRDAIDDMSSTSSSVLLSILKLIDKYDLYGQVAYPKHHKQSDVPDIYRLAAKTKGVFINPAFIEPFGLTLIEAAARGLPIVATKNGGPVDIHRVLDNGVLVDPHNQQSIADALLKLVADKQLWARCREHGLKNIHLFSWPEHCRTYLARVTSCKQRQPKWQRSDDAYAGSESDSPGGSLRDIQDLSLSLKMSLDGERNEGVGTLVLKGQETAVNGKNQVKSAPLKLAANESMEKPENCRFPALRMRKFIFVISVDCDSLADILDISKIIVDAGRTDKDSQSIGFILSTSWSMSEINSLLEKAGLKSSYFDAFICNSGSEIYYPSPCSEQISSESQYMVDSDYNSHIDYRWGGESLRNTLVRWAASVNDKTKDNYGPVITELDSGSSHCYEFRVRDPALVPPFKELRKLMRIQALRCHAIYCKNGGRINVIPVLATRAQALRYLYVRWGMELSNVVVFLGESGDSDYEGLLGGLHKTVILKGRCHGATKIHTNRNYPLEDVVPTDNPKSVECEKCDRDGIKATLGKLGALKG